MVTGLRVGQQLHILENVLDMSDDGTNITITRADGTTVFLSAPDSDAVRWWISQHFADVVQKYEEAKLAGEA